jgi:para-nitrobenzyl esterase
MRVLNQLAGGFAALATFAVASTAQAADAPVIVKTAQGPVQAVERGAMRSFFAIPFAAPPVGDLRWKAPQPAAKWTMTLANTRTGAACLQTGPDSPFRTRGDKEDCLYLDVHAPAAAKGPLPVMVWIHGGAFTTGDASTYADPSLMVGKGVIVVAIHYRLGAMGFLAHPALRDAKGAAGNYGIMDQQAALRWVKANIASFGGNPNNVTIFGESAGGFAVLTHLASPLSKGLFHKAIIQSGAYGVQSQLSQVEMEAKSAAALEKAMAGQETGAACAGGVTTACLRGLPDTVVRGKLMTAYGQSVSNVIPSVDGHVLPGTIQATFAAGRNNRVPVINGSNEDENRMFVAIGEFAARFQAKPPNFDPANRSFLMTPQAYLEGAKAAAGPLAPTAEELTTKYYPLSRFGDDVALQPALATAAAGTDSTFSCHGINVSARIAAQGSPTWAYEFRDQTAIPLIGMVGGRYVLSLPQGAGHAAELPYLFGMAGARHSDEQQALRATMSTYWTNFAKSGDPNGAGAPAWAGFKGGTLQALDVASGGGVSSLSADAFRDQHLCKTAWAKQTF